MDLAFLDQQRLAVILRHKGASLVVCGMGVYRKASDASRELVLIPDRKCDATAFLESLVIREDEWQGEVDEDTEHGCDYQIVVGLGS